MLCRARAVLANLKLPQLPLLVNRRRLLERLHTIIGPKVEIDADVTDFVQVFSFFASS